MFSNSWLPSREQPNLWKGALAGLTGGLLASWVMNQFQSLVPSEAFAKLLGESPNGQSDGGDGDRAEPATVKAADPGPARRAGNGR